MSEEQLFTKKTKTLKIIFFLIFIVLALITLSFLIFPLLDVLHLTDGYTYEVSFNGNSPETAVSTKFIINGYPGYAQLTRNLLRPQVEYKYSGASLFTKVWLVGALFNVPILFAIWLAFDFFKAISKEISPFTKIIYRKLRFLGFVLILLGIFWGSFLSSVLNSWITGVFTIQSNINYYLILIGFIIYAVSDIMKYGTYLQTEMDTLL